MVMRVKAAGCPVTTNSCGSGWLVITGGSTAKGEREGGREEGREGRHRTLAYTHYTHAQPAMGNSL